MIFQSNNEIQSGKVISVIDGKVTIATKTGIVYSDSNGEILSKGDVISVKDGNIIGKLSTNLNTPTYRV